MKEYTLLAIVSVLATLILDNKSGVKVLRRGEFYILLFVIFLFKLIVNGCLTAKNIVMYNFLA